MLRALGHGLLARSPKPIARGRLISERDPEVCDATGDESCTTVGYINKKN
jgi:hypothetical protein